MALLGTYTWDSSLRAKTFLITLETKEKGRDKGKKAPEPTPTP